MGGKYPVTLGLLSGSLREDLQWSSVLPGESAVHTQVGQVAEPLCAALAFLGGKKRRKRSKAHQDGR